MGNLTVSANTGTVPCTYTSLTGGEIQWRLDGVYLQPVQPPVDFDVLADAYARGRRDAQVESEVMSDEVTESKPLPQRRAIALDGIPTR